MDTSSPIRKDMLKINKISDRAIKWIGSISSLRIHTALFTATFLLPILEITPFDQTLLVLTTIVSLEAIYLSIFIQMSVNRSSHVIEIIQEDVEDINENIDEMMEEEEENEEELKESEVISNIEETLLALQKELVNLKKSKKSKK